MVMGVPLFVCYANCCRSVLASQLYGHLCAASSLSAGLEPGEQLSDRADLMLRSWGIDASGHRPTRLTNRLCHDAGAIFAMAPSYLHRLLCEYGDEHAVKTYLFADPFSTPVSFGDGEVRGVRSVLRRPANQPTADRLCLDARTGARNPPRVTWERQATRSGGRIPPFVQGRRSARSWIGSDVCKTHKERIASNQERGDYAGVV